MQRLKSCPFCGGKAEMKQGEFLGHQKVYVQCARCHCMSQAQTEGYTIAFPKVGQHSRYVSLEECKAKVEKSWNMRQRGKYKVIKLGAMV